MTIYAEYLFIENALTGYVILYLTALLCAVHIKTVRLVHGAVLCGIYAFIIMIPDLHPVILTGSKIAASVLIVKVCFREKKIKLLLKQAVVFFAVTVLLAGMCFFTIYTGAASGLISAGGFYMKTGTYANVIIGVFLGFISIKLVWEHIRQRAVHQDTKAEVTIYVNDNTYVMNGIVDTGNFLFDPISGRPVIITDRVHMSREGAALQENRYRLIPYKTLGNETAVMEGIRADRACICKDGVTIREENPVVAIYDGKLFEGKEYEAIVPPAMLVKI